MPAWKQAVLAGSQHIACEGNIERSNIFHAAAAAAATFLTSLAGSIGSTYRTPRSLAPSLPPSHAARFPGRVFVLIEN